MANGKYTYLYRFKKWMKKMESLAENFHCRFLCGSSSQSLLIELLKISELVLLKIGRGAILIVNRTCIIF